MLMPFVAAGGNVVQMDARSRVVGMQAIVSHLFTERDITPLWNELMQRVTQDGTDASAICAKLLVASEHRWSVSISSLTDENHLIATVTNYRFSIKRVEQTSW
jgi:hypothetical protein